MQPRQRFSYWETHQFSREGKVYLWLFLLGPLSLLVMAAILVLGMGALAVSGVGIGAMVFVSILSVSIPVTAALTGLMGGVTLIFGGLCTVCLMTLLLQWLWRRWVRFLEGRRILVPKPASRDREEGEDA